MENTPEKTIEVWLDDGTFNQVQIDHVRLRVGTSGGHGGSIKLSDLVELLNPPKPVKSRRLIDGIPPSWKALTHPEAGLCAEDGAWRLVVREGGRGNWFEVKVYALQPVPSKANYELSWNVYEGRWANGKQLELLRAHRPHLAQLASDVLASWVPVK